MKKLPKNFAMFQAEIVKIARNTDRNSNDENYSFNSRTYLAGYTDGLLRSLGLAYWIWLHRNDTLARNGNYDLRGKNK